MICTFFFLSKSAIAKSRQNQTVLITLSSLLFLRYHLLHTSEVCIDFCSKFPTGVCFFFFFFFFLSSWGTEHCEGEGASSHPAFATIYSMPFITSILHTNFYSAHTMVFPWNNSQNCTVCLKWKPDVSAYWEGALRVTSVPGGAPSRLLQRVIVLTRGGLDPVHRMGVSVYLLNVPSVHFWVISTQRSTPLLWDIRGPGPWP